MKRQLEQHTSRDGWLPRTFALNRARSSLHWVRSMCCWTSSVQNLCSWSSPRGFSEHTVIVIERLFLSAVTFDTDGFCGR